MSENYDNYRIYKYIDAPNKTLIWTHDQIIAFLIPLFVGIWLKQIIVCIVIGIILSCLFSKFEKKYGRGALSVMQYWYLFQLNDYYFIPPSYQRSFIG